jgi:F-type H+-transporting ATPase subunit delta
MANETLARRYAAAIFQIASERDAVDAVGNELRAVSSAIAEDAQTRGFFVSPVIDRKEKERVLSGAFEGKIGDIALHTLLLLVRKRREALLREIVDQYAALQMRARGAEPLDVTSAKELTQDQLRAVVDRLQHAYGKTFDVRQKVDPALIGGLRVTMGDRRIDGSVEGRLEELTRTLFSQQ